MKAGDKIVCSIRGTVKVAVIGSKSNHWLYDCNREPICLEVLAEPYTAINMLNAMKEASEYQEEQALKMWERYAKDFPGEAARDDRHEGANAQLEVTNREYRPVSIHAA